MGVLSFLFEKEKLSYEKKIEDLEKKLQAKEKEVSNLLTELDKAGKITPKQIQIFEKNLNESRQKTLRYEKILASYGLNLNDKFYRYRVELSDFYPKKKFPEVAEKLENNNIKYLDELNEIRLSSLFGEMESFEDIKKKYSDYKMGQFEWEIATLINKGDKLTKVYTKLRKLLNVFSILSFEYMDDIKDFDFNTLKLYNFNSSQISEYKSRRDDYYSEKRILED